MAKSVRVGITGSAGFIGKALASGLTARDYSLSLLQHAARADVELSHGDRIVVGDVTDPSSLAPFMADCSAIIHLVSDFRSAANTSEKSWLINVEGTRNILAAARAAGVRRFIYCSTIGVHGHVRSTPASEDAPLAPGDTYQRTKVAAEQVCRDAMVFGDMEIIIARPASVYGPGDLRMLKMFRMLSKRLFLQAGAARENFHAVYIDDLIGGFLRLLETEGIGGETFILGGPSYVPLRHYIATAAQAVGAPPPWVRVPYAPLLAIAATAEALCRPFGLEPPLHRRRVRFFRNNRAFDISKARQLLGYAPEVELAEGMRRTVAWYRQTGLLT